MDKEYQLDYNIPLNQVPKSIAKKSDYDYIRNNEVEYEWKLENKIDKNDTSVV